MTSRKGGSVTRRDDGPTTGPLAGPTRSTRLGPRLLTVRWGDDRLVAVGRGRTVE